MRNPVLAAGLVVVGAFGCGSSGAVSQVGASGTGGARSGPASATSTATSGTPASSAASTSSTGVGGAGGAPAACSAPSPGAGDHMGMVQSSGTARTYIVHVPPMYDATKATPVVLVFPGFTETDSAIEALTEMDPVSDAHGFLAVYPQGLNDSFNAGSCCGASSTQQVPDVQFVRDMLDQLEKDFCVDPKRVFASGFSNGGMLSHRLGCELSDRIAAVGAVSGTLAISTCAPPRPVPVLHIHGTADPIVGYTNGGLSGAEGVAQTIATWVSIDKCTDKTPPTVYQKGDATCTEYMACASGTNVELCVINGGGHQWPGGQSDFLGYLSTDLDASETLADFFAAHPMP